MSIIERRAIGALIRVLIRLSVLCERWAARLARRLREGQSR